MAGQNQTLAFTVFCIYMIAMAGLAVRGYFINKKNKASAGAAAKADTTHFLGEMSMPTFIIRMNLVASWVSGWIVVSIPDWGASLGPVAFSAMMLANCANGTMNVLWPSVCRLIKHRQYLGPNDFSSDRFNSQILRMYTSLSGIFGTWVTLVIEWIVLKVVATWMFQRQIEAGWLSANAVVWGLVIFIYACEWAGGMESVAVTDAVQCCFLCASFLAVYILINTEYGGFVGLFGSPDEQFDCEAKQVVKTTWPEAPPGWGLVTEVVPPAPEMPYNETVYGCVMYSASTAWWTLYPPYFGQMFMLNVPLAGAVIGLTPAAVHRAMISGSDDSFRRALAPIQCEFAQPQSPLSAPRGRLLTVQSPPSQTIPGFSCCPAS